MTNKELQQLKEYETWVAIPDYLYKCRNLDNDERLILGVVISFEADGKSLYMTKETFADTYGMSVSTVKRKFANLIKNGLLNTNKKGGLVIDWSELEHWLNITKVLRTKKAGPGRKKNQNDTTDENQNDTTDENQVESSENQNDSSKNQNDTSENQNDTNERIKMIPPKNQIEPRKNQNDTQLEKVLEKGLEHQLENKIKNKLENTITAKITSFDDFMKDGTDTKPKTKEEQDLLDFLAELGI